MEFLIFSGGNGISSFLIQSLGMVVYSLFFIVIGGLIISFIENKSNYYLSKGLGFSFGIIFTWLGTVVHELSHLFFVLVGFMKPKDVKLFRPIDGLKDGTLGYVSYTYNKKNLYSRIFLVLVGIAPIIGGTLVILLSLRFLLPDVFSVLSTGIGNMSLSTNVFSFSFANEVLGLISPFFKALFSLNNFGTIKFWVLMYIVLSVASHMSLSGADIKGSLKGVPGLFVLVVIINLVLSAFSKDINLLSYSLTVMNTYIILFLVISIVFSLLNLLITFVLSQAFRIIKK